MQQPEFCQIPRVDDFEGYFLQHCESRFRLRFFRTVPPTVVHAAPENDSPTFCFCASALSSEWSRTVGGPL